MRRRRSRHIEDHDVAEDPQRYADIDGASEEGAPEVDVMAYARLILRQWKIIVGVALLFTAIGAARALTQPKLYRASSKVAFESSPQLIKSQVSLGLDWWKMERHVMGQMEVLKTQRLARRVADRLGLGSPEDGSRDAAAARLAGSISVDRIKDTDILVITMTGSDPHQVAEHLNVYISEFRQANIEDTLERAQEVYRVIQNKLAPLQEQLDRSEERLTAFREREDSLLFADESKNVISEQVNTLTTEYAQAKAERIKLETTIAALRDLRAERIDEASFPEVRNDETIQSLRSERGALQVDLNEQLKTYREGHPVIQDLRSRIAALDTRIHDQVRTIVGSLQADYSVKQRREAALYSNIQQLKNEAIDLSKQSMEFETLRRDYDQNKAFLEEMLARSKEVDISSSADLNNVRIIEPARPPGRPFSPNLERAVLVSVALGLFLGVGLVLGLDFLDQSLRTPDDLERYLGLEALAIFPEKGRSSDFAVTEAYQSLRTAVLLAAREDGPLVLMVTSAAPEEGKTTVAYNVASTFARAGQRVLAIDADLRRPRLHRIVGCGNQTGLASLVLGERLLKDVTCAVPDLPGLYVVTAGPQPPNPPELFSRASFAGLLERAREQYDVVVVDTPPLMSVTDAVICSQHADMVLLVVEYGRMRRQIVRDALRQLDRAGARVVGAVLNRVDLGRDHSYSYHYAYYRHGYESTDAAETGTSA